MPSFTPRNVVLCVVPAVFLLLSMFLFKKKKKKLLPSSNHNASTDIQQTVTGSQTFMSGECTSPVEGFSPTKSASSVEVASDFSNASSDASMLSSPENSIRNTSSLDVSSSEESACPKGFAVANVIENASIHEIPIEKDKVCKNHNSFVQTNGPFEEAFSKLIESREDELLTQIINETHHMVLTLPEKLNDSSISFDDRVSSYMSCDEQNNESPSQSNGLSNGICSPEISSDFGSEDQQNSNVEDNGEVITNDCSANDSFQNPPFIKILNDGNELHLSSEMEGVSIADSHSSISDEYNRNCSSDESERSIETLSKDSPSGVLNVNNIDKESEETESNQEEGYNFRSEALKNSLDHIRNEANLSIQQKEQYSVQLNRNSFFASTDLSSSENPCSTIDSKVSIVSSDALTSHQESPRSQSKTLNENSTDAVSKSQNQQVSASEAKPPLKDYASVVKSNIKLVSPPSNEENVCTSVGSCSQAKGQSGTAVSCDMSVSSFVPESMKNGDPRLEHQDSISSLQSTLSDPFSTKSIENQIESLSQDKVSGLEMADPKSSGVIPGLYVYEFDLAQELCGRLIGKQGKYVKSIKERTNANILIRRHPFDNNLKTVVVEGSRTAVFEALDVIRRKFPPSQFPQVTLLQTNTMSSPAVPLPESLQLHLPEGASCDVILSSLVSAGHFFLQQPTHPTYPSLTTLDQCMISCYSGMDTPLLPHPVEAGVICAAPVMNGWFRAQVIYVYDSSNECQIKFVDYGGFSDVPTSSLRQIRSDFMTLPFQASECYLANVRPVDRNAGWSAEATSVFEELAQGQILQALIVEYAEDGIPCVQLYKVQGVSNMFINQELVERGLAVWVDSGNWNPH